MRGDIVFTAQWKQDAPDDTSEGDTSEDSSSTPVSPDSSEASDPPLIRLNRPRHPARRNPERPSTGGGGIGAAALTLLCSAGILLQFIVRGRRKQAAQ